MLVIKTKYFEQLIPPKIGWFPAHRIAQVTSYSESVLRRVKKVRPDLFCMMKGDCKTYKTLHVHVEQFRNYMRGDE